jgi:hypothetical protein
MSNENSGKKCIAVHLPVYLLNKINENKAKTGKSQSGLIIDLIEKGLGISQNNNGASKMLFFVKVRIDATKMMDFGQKLRSGELDTSQIIMTYCIKDDPTVGMSFWQAENQKSFENVFAEHRVFYKEIMEIIPVATPMDSMKLIIENMKGQ